MKYICQYCGKESQLESSLKLHELKLYSCYYSPKKKINNSYRKNNILF